jgi:hypothetical protein
LIPLEDFDPIAAWGNLEGAGEPAPAPPGGYREYRHYRPFVEAAHSFVKEAQDSRRIYTGIPQFDAEMRGMGSGHLGVLVGFAHGGKTILLLHMLRHNAHKRVAYFCPDEPATLTLTKLTALTSGIPARELEQRVAQDDKEAIRLLQKTALEEFPNLIVFDKTLTPSVLRDGYNEACDVWGEAGDLTVIDYVDLFQAGEVAPAKFDAMKSFIHEVETPMWAIHQTSRSAGAEGRAMTISSGNYGGEQHATFMIGVRRKKSAIMAELVELRVKHQRSGSEAVAERIAELEHDLRIHNYTLTANLVKNKRPGGQLVDEIDFEMGLSTGRLFQMEPGDLPRQYLAEIQSGKIPPKPTTTMQPAWDEQELF